MWERSNNFFRMSMYFLNKNWISVCQRRWNTFFLVRTWKDRIATVRITFLTPSVFRFVMVPEMTAKSQQTDGSRRMYMNSEVWNKKLTRFNRKWRSVYIWNKSVKSSFFKKLLGNVHLSEWKIIDERTGFWH